MKLTHTILFCLFPLLFSGCKSETEKEIPSVAREGELMKIDFATGFNITNYGDFKILTVENPWPDSEKGFRYLLYQKGASVPEDLGFDEKILIPVEKIVVTSTTHIPSLEVLNEEKSLIGFPGLQYISSERTRKLIAEGKIQELGSNEAINTEILLNLRPDVIVTFAVDGSNRVLNNVAKSGIPVIYNSDWTENSPLGKAEWIKFFGALFGKSEVAAKYFEQVAEAYKEAKDLARNARKTPTVLAGSMFRDQWYLPTGNSWHGQFFKDANAEYLYADTEGRGSLSLSFEAVLAKAKGAEFWIGPAQFQSYEEMLAASSHYAQFEAYQKKNIYTFSSEKGETGGVLFYEMAPNRPDIVLKDLISIFHPELLPDYQTSFYKPLK